VQPLQLCPADCPRAAESVEALADTKTAQPQRLAAAVEPLLLPAQEAAALCAVGEASWWRYQSAAKVPAPVKLGGRTLWRRADLELWIELGCPNRAVFEAELKARKGRK
jgi:predicted DNA-binding transcriptional regulator AlpA